MTYHISNNNLGILELEVYNLMFTNEKIPIIGKHEGMDIDVGNYLSGWFTDGSTMLIDADNPPILIGGKGSEQLMIQNLPAQSVVKNLYEVAKGYGWLHGDKISFTIFDSAKYHNLVRSAGFSNRWEVFNGVLPDYISIIQKLFARQYVKR
jgi:hypothetical protein